MSSHEKRAELYLRQKGKDPENARGPGFRFGDVFAFGLENKTLEPWASGQKREVPLSVEGS